MSMSHNVDVEIGFPKSDEDRRLQLASINGSIFAIFFAPLESDGPIHLNCEDWSLILLAPIKSKVDVTITGTNVICLSSIESEEGQVSIAASNQLVNFGSTIQSAVESVQTGARGEHRIEEEPGVVLNYFQLFNKIVSNVRAGTPESFGEAEQRFLAGLCTLAAQIEGKDINIHRVLGVWDIPASLSE